MCAKGVDILDKGHYFNVPSDGHGYNLYLETDTDSGAPCTDEEGSALESRFIDHHRRVGLCL